MPGDAPRYGRSKRGQATSAHGARAMIRIELHIGLRYEVDANGADFIFNIHAAHTPSQAISAESLVINQPVASRLHTDPVNGNRTLRLRALPGELTLSYMATADLTHHVADPHQLAEVPVDRLPPEVLPYLYPSRYCESDRLGKMAIQAFGGLRRGHGRVQAIQDWVRQRVTFTSNTSNSNTSAVDTLIEQVGICRDFAHLMIAMCRALSIPARFTTGTDYGADPALGPHDFHAYVEVYLGDRWYIFEPSGTTIPMGLVRFGTGRDAADVAFATIFGGVQTHAPTIRAWAVSDASQGWVLPFQGHAGAVDRQRRPGVPHRRTETQAQRGVCLSTHRRPGEVAARWVIDHEPPEETHGAIHTRTQQAGLSRRLRPA